MSVSVTIKQLLEAGVHFGHQTRRWNPKMSQFIFGERNGIYIIDLEKTLKLIEKATAFLRQCASQGQSVLLVGTKKQAQQVIQQVAQAAEMPYVNHRWLGGMLTNFETIRKSIKRLEQIELMEQEGTYQFITKKEVGSLNQEREKLKKVLTGIRLMKKLPSALFIIDPVNEDIAVREARKLGIPIVALIDTNCDPDLIDYPIPGNDDAIRSVKLIGEIIMSALLEGRKIFAATTPAGDDITEESFVKQDAELASSAVLTEDTTDVISASEIVPAVEQVVEIIEEKVTASLDEKEKARPKKTTRTRKE